ncbi:hypothetical protein [Capnocytophaga stomatis]|uniref:Uncharacterized protein n=1 Tax=Capnocytophaga stomatis TaxID=1848904 RepID=A0ABW8QD51_9FLAO|nr:hypothetical protein [Capnocytophaga stomatis]GIJ95067.1 hypothetical protein CAPN002_22850 [Capnocytophaga stomatis]
MESNRKNIIILILVLLLSIVLTDLFLQQKQNDIFRTEISEVKYQRDSIKQSLLKRNKELLLLLEEYQEKIIKNNKLQKIDGITLGNKPISLEELIDIANENQKKYYEQRIQNAIDSLTINRFNRIIEQLKKNKIITDSIYSVKILKLKRDVQAKDMILKLIKKNYEIDSKIEIDSTHIKVKLINTQKIDSALLIFPHYKHKIKTNKKGEVIVR